MSNFSVGYTIISSINNDGACALVNLDVVKQNRKNLLIGSCGNAGELYEAVACGRNPEKASEFYDYFEIYPTDDEKERAVYRKVYELGTKLGIPVAATGNCHYLRKEDEICRRVIRIANGHEHDNKKFFYHTTDEMLSEFAYLGKAAAYKSVVINTNKIADLITQIIPVKEGFYPPVMENAYELVHELAYAKAKEIYGHILPVPIAERLKTELKYIQKHEYAVYYWIAHRMVRYLNDSGYYVGDRGAVGSVLVAFLLGISNTNPLPAHYYCPECNYIDFEVSALDGFDLPDRVCPVCGCPLRADGHNIPYETFMGYDGSTRPDIDLNVPVSKIYSELAFMKKLFGDDRVAHAGDVTTLLWRHTERYISVYEAKTGDYFTEEQRDYIRSKICGIKQDDGIHPCGIIVLPQGVEFEEFTPLRETQGPSPIKKTTHINYYPLLDNSVVKLDVIGICIPDMLKLLEEFTGCSIQDVVWNDPRVHELFEHADTLGIPDFDTDSMKDRLLKLKPKSFNDLVQIRCLNYGEEIWTDNCENLLNDGYSLSELPVFRDHIFQKLMRYGFDRDSSFKIAEFARKGKFHFYQYSDMAFELIERMRDKNVPEWYIQCLRKTQYLFPKAHAVVYVMNSVRMAWYKIYYPTEFYAAYLSCWYPGNEPRNEADEQSFSKVIEECAQRGIQLLKPDAEKSHCSNYLPEQGNIRMPYVK